MSAVKFTTSMQPSDYAKLIALSKNFDGNRSLTLQTLVRNADERQSNATKQRGRRGPYKRRTVKQ